MPLLEVCQEWGALEEVEGSWSGNGGQGCPYCQGGCFRVDILIKSVSGIGDQEGGVFEDVEGFWLET